MRRKRTAGRLGTSLPFALAVGGFFAIAGVLLLGEHRAHALGALLLLLPLLALLLYGVLHRGSTRRDIADANADGAPPSNAPRQRENRS